MRLGSMEWFRLLEGFSFRLAQEAKCETSLQQQFRKMDKDKSGMLQASEARAALQVRVGPNDDFQKSLVADVPKY